MPLLCLGVGLEFRSAAIDGKFWDAFATWDVADIPDLSGKVAIVTGPTVPGQDHVYCLAYKR